MSLEGAPKHICIGTERMLSDFIERVGTEKGRRGRASLDGARREMVQYVRPTARSEVNV